MTYNIKTYTKPFQQSLLTMNIREARQQFDLLLSVDVGNQNAATSDHINDTVLTDNHDDDEVIIETVQSSPRKRKRESNRMKAHDPVCMSHVMTLYDRSINLNKLSTGSTLYSASREWMLNNPSAAGLLRSPKSARSDDDAQAVYCYDCTDTAPYLECDAPTPTDGSSVPVRAEVDITTLRKMNIRRWKGVREKWRETYEENFRAHPECVNFIKALYQPPK